MSVYKRKDARTYSYDFEYRGHRFSGDTGQVEKHAAKQVEDAKRADAMRQMRVGSPVNGTLTLEATVTRYWNKVAQHHVNSLEDLSHLEWLTNEIGRKTPLSEIDDNRVALVVAKRRCEPAQAGRNKGQPVSPATVNRTATEPLRKLMRRTQKVWKLKVGDVNWSNTCLPNRGCVRPVL